MRALTGLRASAYCAGHDLADPITLLIATGLRRSELLALQWSDFDADAATLSVTGKLVRATGHGLQRVEDTKTAAGLRTVTLPKFAVDVLTARYGREQTMLFPATSGTWRDPNNFGKAWRSGREALGVPEVTPYSFRKTVATLIDDGGLSARIAAHQLGHARVSMTQDRYVNQSQVRPEVADLLDRTISHEYAMDDRQQSPKIASEVEVMQRYSNLDTVSKIFQKLRADGRISPSGRAICRSDRSPEAAQPFKLDQRLDGAIRAEIVINYASGESSAAIATRYGLGKNSVIKVLREAGVPIRGQSLSSDQIEEAAGLYEAGQSLAKIGERLDTNYGTVWRALKKRGVQMRDTHGRLK